MFSISQIRAKARETVNTTQGIFLLAVIPVAITFIRLFMQFFLQRNTSQLSYLVAQRNSTAQFIISDIVFPVLYQLLTGLIILSLTYTLFQIIRKTKEGASFGDAFAIFNSPHFGKIFQTFFVKQIFLFLWSLVLLVSTVLFTISSRLSAFYFFTTGSVEAIPEDARVLIGFLFFLGFVLMLAGIALLLPQYYAYSQVEFILFEQLEKDEYAGATAIIKESRQVMKGFKWKRFGLDLSFIGWSILFMITFGLAGIYVFPYYYAAQLHFSQAVKDEVQMRQAAYFSQFNQPTNSNP